MYYFKIAMGTFALLLGVMSYGQKKETLIDGRVQLYNGNIIPVTVENKRTKEKTKTDQTGYFLINVQQQDTIRFISDYSSTMLYVVDYQDLNDKRITVSLVKPGQSLEEIVIVKKDFGSNEFNFGEIKKLTAAEKRYNADNQLFSATGNLGLGISIDAIINRFSGKRKRDKQLIEYEKIQNNISSFYNQYPKDLLMKNLAIPEDQVDAFVLFFVTQPGTDKVKVSQTEDYELFLAQHYDEFLSFIKK